MTRIPQALALFTTAMLVGSGAHRAQSGAKPVFDSGRAYEHLTRIVSFGPRPPGSAALEATRKYIREELARVRVKVRDQAFDASTPVGNIRMVNLIAAIPGRRPERIIFGGHYDTKLYREFRFVGANDAGSSTAFLLELARVLAARQNPFTVEIVFFDGEEALRPEWAGTDHTYGSRHYVETARRDKTLNTIAAMILVDMIADRNLNISRESASTPWLTDLVWAASKRLGFQRYFLDQSTPIEDDHVAFLDAGVPAVNIIDLDYQPWHTAGDTLDKVSARSMQVVGDVLLEALPSIEKRLAGPAGGD
ncbi:MAG: M28 family peptidase [Vicinamibacterales bacterium]